MACVAQLDGECLDSDSSHSCRTEPVWTNQQGERDIIGSTRTGAERTPSGPTSKVKEPSSAHLARKPQYRELLALSEQAMGPEQIAPLVGLSERTVYRWLTQANAPSWHHQARSSSVIDPYQASLLKRWQEGCRK